MRPSVVSLILNDADLQVANLQVTGFGYRRDMLSKRI